MSKIFSLLVACLLLAACAELGVTTPRPTNTAGQPTATTGQPTPAAEVNMCQLMPLGDVQPKSPFQTALAEFEEGVVPGMCEYSSALDAEEPVSILLVMTPFQSAADAQTSLASARQSNVDIGVPVTDLSGLGDKAFAGGSDEVGVHAVLGNLVIDANMGGEWPDTTDDAKVAAGTELVRTIIARLP
jgi:hypothetical protein